MILAQKTGNDVLWFLYDSDGARVGFTYNGTAYYYTQNAQGDVTGIVDSSCNTVVEYSYDAWGKLLGTTGSLASTIGAANPFRYRGYYYDTETGLYYLQSRYYDPQTGRFLNADALISTATGLLGYNMFAYCNNNPILMVDDGGTRPILGTSRETPEERTLSFKYMHDQSNILYYKEHTKGVRKSTEGKHQKGKTRKQMDAGGEKGDSRRKSRSNKRNPSYSKIEIPPISEPAQKVLTIGTVVGVGIIMVGMIADDTTGIGVANDVALAPLSKIWWESVIILVS